MTDSSVLTPLRIVSIGGGTGLSALLQGLKRYAPAIDITAVVTVTDDGGSSGRLRREFEVLPPGDIRNCMVALSEDEGLLAKLFRYRFSSGRGLKGHSFGNLFLTALADITGDFQHAVKLSSEVLAIAGRIYPSTAANVTLEARFADGRSVVGESRISKSRTPIDSIRLRPARCKPLKETLAAIANADLITLGPGSLFTSVVPNLLVGGVSKAIKKSSALKAYFCNLMWQPGETMQFRASDHVKAIHRHARCKLLDTVVVNTGEIKPSLRKRYARAAARPVENDLGELEAMGLDVLAGDLVARSERVRHSPEAIATMAVKLAFEGRRGKNAAK